MNLLLRAFGMRDESPPRTAPCPCCGQSRRLGWPAIDLTTVEGVTQAFLEDAISTEEFVEMIHDV